MLQFNTKAANPPLHSAANIREIEMEVVFGTPSRNCSGAGICLIAARFPQGHKIPCPHAPAIINYVPGRELVFRFRKHRISDTAVRRYFHKRYFLVEEAFELPQRLVRHWQLPQTHIPPGKYQLEEYSQEWRLYFMLE